MVKTRKELLKIARHYKREIALLEEAQEKLYKIAAKEIDFDENDDGAFDYFFNDYKDYKTFEERLC